MMSTRNLFTVVVAGVIGLLPGSSRHRGSPTTVR